MVSIPKVYFKKDFFPLFDNFLPEILPRDPLDHRFIVKAVPQTGQIKFKFLLEIIFIDSNS